MTADDRFEIIADEYCRRIISIAADNGNIIISNLGLSKRQYYKRYSTTIKVGVIRKNNGNVHLTSFGKIVHEMIVELQIQLGFAIRNYYNCRAADSIVEADMPQNEKESIISELITNPQIRKVLAIV